MKTQDKLSNAGLHELIHWS